MPSLIIDSPSTSSRTRSGAPRRRKIEVAAIVSVGAMMAPRTAASAQLRPGTVAWATRATTAAVRKTRPIESSASGRITVRSSSGEARQPAA